MLNVLTDELGPDLNQYFQGAVRRAHRAGLEEVARAWHRDFLPMRFRSFGGARYGLQRRGRGYTRRKARRGVEGPLEWSGRLRRAAEGSRKIRATQKGVSVRFQGLPPYVRVMRVRERDEMADRLRAAIGRGEAVARNQRRLQRLLASRTAGKFPDIPAELVLTPEREWGPLRRIYLEAARRALERDPRARRRTRRRVR